MPDAFEKLQQLVLDENKTVTYKTLCRTLDIPANKAKQCLSDFFEQHGTEYGLSALYILIGISSLKKSSQLCSKAIVVAGDELEKAKNQYTSLNSMHVYAVQKGKLMDENSLYNVDYGKMEQVEDHNKFSSIRNPFIYVQAGQQIKHVNIPKDADLWKPSAPKNQAAPKKETPKVPATKNKTPNLFSLFPKKSDEQQRSLPETISQNSVKSDSSTDQKKSKTLSPEKGQERKTSASSTSSSTIKNDVKYFFAKQAEKPSKKEAKSSESKSENKLSSKGKETSPKEVKLPSKSSSPSSRHESKKAKVEKSKMSRKSKRQDADGSDEDFAPMKKKHRRILTMDDSDSESENEQEKEDKAQRELFNHELPPTTTVTADTDEDVIPPTPPVKNGKKKKWKVVSKTFEDEDGYFVTRKEKELVTDSEDSGNEKPAPAKAPVRKESPKLSPVKKKQSSLMNFFKQK